MCIYIYIYTYIIHIYILLVVYVCLCIITVISYYQEFKWACPGRYPAAKAKRGARSERSTQRVYT